MKLSRFVWTCAIAPVWIVSQSAYCQMPPVSAPVWMERGKAELKRAFFADAETDFRNAIALEPDNAKAYTLLARALIGQLFPNVSMFPDTQGLLPKAEEAITHALALSPEDSEALCVEGIVNYKFALMRRDPKEMALRLNEAKAAYDHALRVDPNSIEAHCELARMVVDMASMAFIRARSESRIKVGPPGPIVPIETRRMLQGRYASSVEDAMAHARRALEIDPQSVEGMNQLGGVFHTRAYLRDNDTDFAADMEAGNKWQNQAMAIRRRTTPETGLPAGFGAVLGALPTKAPPPPAAAKQP